jgi:hypothetical protein
MADKDLNLKLGAEPDGADAPEPPAPPEGANAPVNCDGCHAVFISQVPGSRIYVGEQQEDNEACPTDGFVVFSPVGEPRPNPLKPDTLLYPFGVALVKSEEVAGKIRRMIKCGGTPFREFNPDTDGELGCFVPDAMCA